ncbi:MAG: hypothetical protein KDE26_12785, partial [Bacteroidetes bacterium]|nr:hypothetical protein [Bacteroidota bacterium]
MKRRLLLLALVFGISLPSFTQTSDVDVTKLVADTKTFIFNNNKNTVKGYIYSQLKDVTGCCGNDRIYLEVKIDPSGYVLNVKTLTGKNDCFKQSAIDIVKNVKWDASDFKGPKSIYFEIKPNIECEGNRENTYAQVEIFNNELLDTEGNRNGNNATALNTVRNSDPIADNTTTQNKTETKTAEKEEPKTDPKVAKKDPIASNTQPVKKDPPQQQATRSQDPTPKADNTVAIKNEPPAKTKEEQEAEAKKKADELAAAKKKAAEERAAQEEEINKLKEQMARLRSQEEAARERRLAQERAEADRERERKERDAQMAQNNDDNSGEGGGLFLDDVADSNRDNGTVSNDNEPPTGRTEEERIQNELAQLEAQKREIEQKMRDSENNTRQLLQENDRASQEWLRVEEQILEKKERMAQQREDQELNRLEEDRRKAQDRERQSSDEYQRMMDEIRRLQQEADRKIAELETQKQDIERLAAAKQAREQEIMLARTLRETEIEQELESKRLTVMNSGRAAMNPTSIADVTTPSSGEVNLGDMAIPVLTTKEDSQKYIALARTVNLLKVELERLREQLRIMEGGAPSPNSSSI